MLEIHLTVFSDLEIMNFKTQELKIMQHMLKKQ